MLRLPVSGSMRASIFNPFSPSTRFKGSNSTPQSTSSSDSGSESPAKSPSLRGLPALLTPRAVDVVPMRLYFKLRGSSLSAHLAPGGEALFRANVNTVLSVDDKTCRILVKVAAGRGVHDGQMGTLGGNHVLVSPSGDSDHERWKAAFYEASSTSFTRYYKKLRKIGSGHFSDVYLAQDRSSREKVAVKIIKRDGTDKDKNRKFIRREVKVLSVTDHENLIKAIDFFSQNNKPHIVLEYLPCGTLKDLVEQHSRLNENVSRVIFAGILRGVSYLHSMRIVHRDIKPENILMASPSVPKITDFGLSTFLNSDEDKIHSVVGTPSYVSPELCAGVPYGTPADIWSCGVMLFFMLSGLRPFVGDTKEDVRQAILHGGVKFPEAAFRRVGMNAKKFILRMLDMNQTTRITADQALSHPWFTSA